MRGFAGHARGSALHRVAAGQPVGDRLKLANDPLLALLTGNRQLSGDLGARRSGYVTMTKTVFATDQPLNRVERAVDGGERIDPGDELARHQVGERIAAPHRRARHRASSFHFGTPPTPS
jgi:hypothetical protein